jgi:hypothetical protein
VPGRHGELTVTCWRRCGPADRRYRRLQPGGHVRAARHDIGWPGLPAGRMAHPGSDEHGGRRKRGRRALSYDPAAAERVRQLLSGRSDVAEKTMVSGLSFLVNGNMCSGITGTALMVRVGAERRAQALREPRVRPMLFAGPCPASSASSRTAMQLMIHSRAGYSEDSTSSSGSRPSRSARAANPLAPGRQTGQPGPRPRSKSCKAGHRTRSGRCGRSCQARTVHKTTARRHACRARYRLPMEREALNKRAHSRR